MCDCKHCERIYNQDTCQPHFNPSEHFEPKLNKKWRMKISTPQIRKAKPIGTQDLDHMSQHRKKNKKKRSPF